MTTLDRLKLLLAAMDTENGVNRWWQRVYALPDRTTPGDVWIYAREAARPIEAKRKRGKSAA